MPYFQMPNCLKLIANVCVNWLILLISEAVREKKEGR